MPNITSLTNLAPLFAFIAQEKNVVLWLWTLDHQKKLYVSDGLYKQWGIEKDDIDNEKKFYSLVVAEDIPLVEKMALERLQIISSHHNSEVYFRIKKPDGNINYIYDFSFILLDDDHKPFARAALSYSISEWEWRKKSIKLPIKEIAQSFQLLKYIYKATLKSTTYIVKTADNTYQLNRREAQCLFYLLKGYSNKEIASTLDISTRTIETYFDHLRSRFNVHSRMHLITMIENIEEVESWEFVDSIQKANLEDE